MEIVGEEDDDEDEGYAANIGSGGDRNKEEADEGSEDDQDRDREGTRKAETKRRTGGGPKGDDEGVMQCGIQGGESDEEQTGEVESKHRNVEFRKVIRQIAGASCNS